MFTQFALLYETCNGCMETSAANATDGALTVVD